MHPWHEQLAADLGALERAAGRRRLRVLEVEGRCVHLQGRRLVNLSGNDYLALAGHPRLKQAAIAAIEQAGVGSGASRLISGHQSFHQRAEAAFARFKHAPTALLCPTGYLANHAALTALAGAGDLLCLDKLCHASLIDAARASGAEVRVYPHRQTDKLARLLQRHREEAPGRRRFIVTDSVFSMDGDTADLPALCDLAREQEAITVVDEAHGTGVLGEDGSGLCAAQGVSGRVDVVVSTASKALGGLGGIITAEQVVIDTILNRARAFIYTTAVPPAQAAAIEAAVAVVAEEPWRRERVRALAQRLRAAVAELGASPGGVGGPGEPGEAETLPEALPGAGINRAAGLPPAPGLPGGVGEIVTPIVPVMAGSSEAALALASHLEQAGFFAPAIRPPTVAPGAARVRLTVRADLEDEDMERLCEALHQWRAD